MNEIKKAALHAIDAHADIYTAISDAIWDEPELSLKEFKAAALYTDALEKLGFTVQKNLCGIETAFSGSYGSGHPVIGILGEFDALSGLSQQSGVAEAQSVTPGGNGHGCGHNLLGTGAFAAALGLKHYLEANHRPGTVKFFACPAEEGGSGKGFMARAGVFNGMDAAFCWHPGTVNSAATESTMANYQVCYHFYGTSSHAAMSPELGRSALDALELMNNGVQYLREHIPTNTRVHYAITNAGGNAPGIVQAYAEGLYLMRAPQLPQVKELYERVNRIAQGAAMMTDTRVEIEFIKACSNTVLNTELLKLMQKNMEQLPPVQYDEDDLAFARALQATNPVGHSYFDTLAADVTDPAEKARLEADKNSPIHGVVMPYPPERQGFVSSDVGDVSWVCPLAQINGTTMPADTAMHTWQMVSVGKSPMAKKGMLFAGRVMAACGIDCLEDPDILRRAKEEKDRRTGGRSYDPPIPPEVMPRIPKENA